MDASALILTAILLASGALLIAGFASLRGLAAPRRTAAAASLSGSVPVRIVCPQTRLLTRIRIRAERRGSDVGLRVHKCERFPDGGPLCREECLDLAAHVAEGLFAVRAPGWADDRGEGGGS